MSGQRSEEEKRSKVNITFKKIKKKMENVGRDSEGGNFTFLQTRA